jgi:hypothetical protein
MKLKTVKITAKYVNGIELRAGKWKIGSVVWNSMSSPKGASGEILKYAAHCLLPGIKGFLGNFETEEEGIKKLQSTLDNWMKGLEQ